MTPIFEVVGYIASGLIVLSIVQKSILRLRIIGLGGSFAFIAYGVLISAYPIVAVNILTASIHIWFLRKLTARKSEVFEILHVAPESRYLRRFLDHYRSDISRFQPDFAFEPRAHDLTAFVLRDLVPAGLLVGSRAEDGSVELGLDYAIPAYRDFRMGAWVFSRESGLFVDDEVHRVVTSATTPEHARYLRRMGFTDVSDSRGQFEIAAQR